MTTKKSQDSAIKKLQVQLKQSKMGHKKAIAQVKSLKQKLLNSEKARVAEKTAAAKKLSLCKTETMSKALATIQKILANKAIAHRKAMEKAEVSFEKTYAKKMAAQMRLINKKTGASGKKRSTTKRASIKTKK